MSPAGGAGSGAGDGPEGHAIRLPDGFGARAGEVLDGGAPPAVPRDAATVMLLRQRPFEGRPGPLQVYMLRRASTMAFAPGALVFPGGSVDARDAEAEVGWAGPDPAEWGERLGAAPELARALVCAAVRETFEESGVLLAGPSADTVVASTVAADWEADRQALLSRSLSLADLLRRRELVLRSDLLRPWARWITPVVEPRRFDTRFFAAALPEGQRARDVSGEAEGVAWIAPADVLAAARKREVLLLPPTAVCLGELRDCGDLPAALAARRRIVPLMPQVEVNQEGAAWLTLPPGVEYPR